MSFCTIIAAFFMLILSSPVYQVEMLACFDLYMYMYGVTWTSQLGCLSRFVGKECHLELCCVA